MYAFKRLTVNGEENVQVPTSVTDRLRGVRRLPIL